MPSTFSWRYFSATQSRKVGVNNSIQKSKEAVSTFVQLMWLGPLWTQLPIFPSWFCLNRWYGVCNFPRNGGSGFVQFSLSAFGELRTMTLNYNCSWECQRLRSIYRSTALFSHSNPRRRCHLSSRYPEPMGHRRGNVWDLGHVLTDFTQICQKSSRREALVNAEKYFPAFFLYEIKSWT